MFPLWAAAMARLDNQWDIKIQPLHFFPSKKSNIISISNKKENGLLDCPSSIQKKIILHTEVSALEMSTVKCISLWQTAQHSNSWHEMNSKITPDKKGTLSKKNAIIPMGVAPGHLR